jgi:hypothetical protein
MRLMKVTEIAAVVLPNGCIPRSSAPMKVAEISTCGTPKPQIILHVNRALILK